MDNLVNEPFLVKRGKYARYASYVGFGSLFVGLLSVNRSMALAYGMLMIGLIAASIGAYLANRYVKEPRADRVFADALQNLDKRYVLYQYYFPTNHLLMSHFGLTVLDPYAQGGTVSYHRGHWRHKAGFRKIMQIFGDPALGKPDSEIRAEVARVKKWIDELMPGQDIPVTGVAVFTNPTVQLDVEDCPVPAVRIDGLATFVKDGLKGGRVLSTALQNQLRKTLDDVIAAQ